MGELPFGAGNGLIDRRALLGGGGLMLAGAAAAAPAGAAAIGDPPPWMLAPGEGFTPYGTRSPFEDPVQRILTPLQSYAVAGSSRTPLHRLHGTITPNSLHFERHHNGVPGIDPAAHRLILHGRVRRPVTFDLETLLRYPSVSRLHFIECSGNSRTNTRAEPPQESAGAIHGLFSAAEWTGVPLRLLLEEAGIDPAARWVIAEGADAAGLTRSIPLAKCLDDAMIALFQNGEALRPEQGYPMRLLLPGYEGNTNVKWLRRLKVAEGPLHSRFETSTYTQLLPDGKARQFVLPMEVKSVILRPSFGLALGRPGFYEISGLAWSGRGRVAKVEVSADGGRSWAEAAIGDAWEKAPVRFRLLWQWNGAPAVLMSRATDTTGDRQPTRTEWLARFAPGQPYHYNGIQSWSVSARGEVANVHA